MDLQLILRSCVILKCLICCKYDLNPMIIENKDTTFTHSRVYFIQFAEAIRTCTMVFLGNSGRLSGGQ